MYLCKTTKAMAAVTSENLPGFEGGLFVPMSTDTTFQLYRWNEIAERTGMKLGKK
jgi:hypothetical protein